MKTLKSYISITGPTRCTIWCQFITINILYMFWALICSSSGGTVYTTVDICCAYYVGWLRLSMPSRQSKYTSIRTSKKNCKTNAAIKYNKARKHKHPTPNYISIEINDNNPQSQPADIIGTKYTICCIYSASKDGFGGLVVSMLASGSRVRGLKPGWSRWIFNEC
jgi:hypothetical protein